MVAPWLKRRRYLPSYQEKLIRLLTAILNVVAEAAEGVGSKARLQLLISAAVDEPVPSPAVLDMLSRNEQRYKPKLQLQAATC